MKLEQEITYKYIGKSFEYQCEDEDIYIFDRGNSKLAIHINTAEMNLNELIEFLTTIKDLK